MPNDSIKVFVPPVETKETPSALSFFKISSKPSLWYTETSARLIRFVAVIVFSLYTLIYQECKINDYFFLY